MRLPVVVAQRARELREAARIRGVGTVELLDHVDPGTAATHRPARSSARLPNSWCATAAT